jgi:hypothetical protein
MRVIYVAAGWEERHIAHEYMGRLERAGFEIALDWTRSRDNKPVIIRGAEEESRASLAELAAENVLALQRAQAFWLLGPLYPEATEAWCEFGYAYATFGQDAAYPILVSGPERLRVGYAALPNVLLFPTHEEAFEALSDYMKIGKAIRVRKEREGSAG